MMKLFILISFLLLSNNLAKVVGYCSYSESSNLRTCYDNYFHTLGLKSFDYFDYEGYLSDYFTSASDIETLCSYYMTLTYCIGTTIVSDCMNNDGIYQAGISNSYWSSDFVANYFQLEFLCGKGKKAFKKEYKCMADADTYDCKNQDSNSCSDIKSYINCVSKATKKACGQDGYYFTNNYLSIEYCYTEPQCNTCTSDANSNKQLSFFIGFISIIIPMFFLKF